MTIQSKINSSSEIVETVQDQVFLNFQIKNPTLSDIFFYNNKKAKLSIFPKFLLLQTDHDLSNTSSQKLCIKFEFSLKAQLIEEEKGNIQSKFIGFNLLQFHNKKYQFVICEGQKILLWIKQLSKKIIFTNFSEHYTIKNALGSGEYSEVFEVQRMRDKKHFAVKRINKRISYSQINGEEAVQSQIQILRSLPPHPNIAKIYAVYQSQKSIFILQKLIAGQTLQNFLYQKNYKLQTNQIRKIIQGILEALNVLKSQKIIHRDLKPGNILIEKNGNPVIIDFGISVKIISENQKFQICGSPGFIAPEIIVQKQENKINEKSDIFSLGCIFYFLLTNRTLFGGDTTDQIFQRNKQCHINWKDPCLEDLTQDQLDLLKKMLTQNPQERISAQKALEHNYFKIVKQYSKSLDEYLKQNLFQQSSNTKTTKDYHLKLKNTQSKFQQLFTQKIQISFINDKINLIDPSNKENYNICLNKDESESKKLINCGNQKDNQDQLKFNFLKLKLKLKEKNAFQWNSLYSLSKNLIKNLNLAKNIQQKSQKEQQIGNLDKN